MTIITALVQLKICSLVLTVEGFTNDIGVVNFHYKRRHLIRGDNKLWYKNKHFSFPTENSLTLPVSNTPHNDGRVLVFSGSRETNGAEVSSWSHSYGREILSHKSPLFTSNKLNVDTTSSTRPVTSPNIHTNLSSLRKKRRHLESVKKDSFLLGPFLIFLRYLSRTSYAIASTTSVDAISKPSASHSFIFTSVALVSSKIKKTLQNILLTQPKLPSISKHAIFKLLVATLIVSSTIDVVRTKKRQSTDATSEWGRYADHPSKRGLALSMLCVKLSPFIIASSILNRFQSEFDSKSRISLLTSKLQSYSGSLLADTLLRLGPLYIKIGQILSCRENLLPNEWIIALQRLQDSVPAKSGPDAYELAYAAYDGGKKEFESIFEEFDDVPLAAASLGQVHKATLKPSALRQGSNSDTDGGSASSPPQQPTTVAIKLQRSRLRDIYDKDLALMQKIAKAVDKFTTGKANRQVGGVQQSWVEIFNDAEDILYREIDYRDEANNAIRFANDFGLGLGGSAIPCTAIGLDGKALPSASSWMRTPYVFDDLSTEKVLVMEYVPSIKISNNIKLEEAGLSYEDKEVLAENLARAYLRQFCVNKFFSTDPHPGNLGVEIINDKNGEKSSVRLVFYDFGQACALGSDQAGGILNVIEGIVDMDVDSCVTAFDRMGVLVDGADLDKVKSKVQDNFETGKVKVKTRKRKMRLSDSSSIENSEIEGEGKNASSTADEKLLPSATNSNSTTTANSTVEKVDDAEIMSYFTMPAEYAFVARAISQMDGVGKNLDPDFDFISASAPYLVEIKGSEKYVLEAAQKFVTNVEKKGLKWQKDVFRALGFDAKNYMKKKD